MLGVSDAITAGGATAVLAIAGLEELWAETLGDSRICIAILDGPVDSSHPSLANANLTRLETLVSGIASQGPASQHGTHIASVIFGQHDGPIKGIAPQCRGLIVPVFRNGTDGSIAPCSQLDLARAITQAVQAGAHIINVSGGEFSPSGTAHPLLVDVVQNCVNNKVLVVAAAGNEGCECLHIPGALPSVLAVGAMNSQGLPLKASNWGEQYQTQGILSPGENILGASLGGGTVINSGTSYATPIVSGIVALLLSIQLIRGQEPNLDAVRAVMLSSAVGCDEQPAPDCRRLLAGRLNVSGAMSQLPQGGASTMSEPIEMQENAKSHVTEDAYLETPAVQPAADVQSLAAESSDPRASTGSPQPPTEGTATSRENDRPVDQGSIDPSCMPPMACSPGYWPSTSAQLVFALGTLGFDHGTEARRDSIQQHMGKDDLLTYLDKNPWDAAAILWTLNLDATIYVIRPVCPFSGEAYRRLRKFLGEQLKEGVERVSVPGMIIGRARLMSGQVVPVIQPELRGMRNWTTAALINAVCGSVSSKSTKAEKEAYTQKTEAVRNFFERVYHELRNLGMMPQERAINYAATNAFNVEKIFESALREEMELDTIEVERSPIFRPDSDCWEVKLTFFNPSKVFKQARKVYLYTVDVSDVVPVMVGPFHSWFVR